MVYPWTYLTLGDGHKISVRATGGLYAYHLRKEEGRVFYETHALVWHDRPFRAWRETWDNLANQGIR